ncbi:MAG: hypothetical protein JWO79_5096 [Actinomycetia bacterium]|nr:hypothetical protein [Actinomycetes bacterium]MDQ1646152.1 hypothetical protein [Cryptosporangiaceae bacterium]
MRDAAYMIAGYVFVFAVLTGMALRMQRRAGKARKRSASADEP